MPLAAAPPALVAADRRLPATRLEGNADEH
jgi:hypothetical protein